MDGESTSKAGQTASVQTNQRQQHKNSRRSLCLLRCEFLSEEKIQVTFELILNEVLFLTQAYPPNFSVRCHPEHKGAKADYEGRDAVTPVCTAVTCFISRLVCQRRRKKEAERGGETQLLFSAFDREVTMASCNLQRRSFSSFLLRERGESARRKKRQKMKKRNNIILQAWFRKSIQVWV